MKGGAEHNLPILISRIFKDQAGTLKTLKISRYLKISFSLIMVTLSVECNLTNLKSFE